MQMQKIVLCLVMAGMLAGLMPAAAPTSAYAATLSTTTTVSFEPEQSRYPRGQWITLKAVIRDQHGSRVLPPGRVTFKKRSTLGIVTLSTVTINDNGIARMSFQVPTNPNDDWVYIEAHYVDPLGFFGRSSGQKRIPIG